MDITHTGMPGHECHGDCTQVYTQNDVASSRQLLTPFSPDSPASPAAVTDYRNVTPGISPLAALAPPERAILHPLALNCVQLK